MEVAALIISIGAVIAALVGPYVVHLEAQRANKTADTALSVALGALGVERQKLMTTFITRWSDASMMEARALLGGYTERSSETLEAFQRFLTNKTATSEIRQLNAMLDFFEDLGSAVKSEAIPIEMMDSVWGTEVLQKWAIFEPTIEFMQKTTGRLTSYENFKTLAVRLGELHGDQLDE